jgi:hypothetical protein
MKSLDPKGRGRNVTRLAEWAKQSAVFENEEQVKGALTLANQQYLDGLGDSFKDWVGITDDERAAWMRADHELPQSLRIPKRSRKIALESLLRASVATLDDMVRDGSKGTSLPADKLREWRDTLQATLVTVKEFRGGRKP